jgi:putative ABC transport system substrate-binding protein
MLWSKLFLKGLLLLTLTGFMAPASALAAGSRVALLVGSGQAPFKAAAQGVENCLSSQAGDVELLRFQMPKEEAERAKVLSQVASARVDLVVALGSLAVDEASEIINNTPIVAGMVMDLKQGGGNMTGVSLEIPIEIQLAWMKRFLPQANTVGIVYNPQENSAKVASFSDVALGRSVKIEGRTVSAPNELMPALEGLGNDVDVLLGISDKVALTSKTAQKVLLFSFRNRIPFVGLSEAWVKAGALYALDRDYEDIGTQCGELALGILNGAQVADVAPAFPRKIRYSLNMKSADRMKLRLASALVEGATKVY